MRTRMRSFALLGGGAVLLGAALTMGGDRKAMPDLRVTQWVSAKTISQEALRGKPYVVEFWATWCPPCRKSTPHLVELAKKYQPMGLAIIGVTSEPATALGKVQRFAKQFGMNYYVGFEQKLGKTLNVQGIPTAFVVDHAGRIAWRGHPMSPAFEGAIVAALGEWRFPTARFPRTAAAARATMVGTASNGVAPLKAIGADSERGKEVAEALKVLSQLAQAEVAAARAIPKTDPVERVLALRRVASKYEGLAVAGAAAAEAKSVVVAESRKSPRFADEVALSEERRALQEKVQARSSAAAARSQTEKGRLEALTRVLAGAVREYDALIKRYPGVKSVDAVRADRDKAKAMITRIKNYLAR